MARDCWGEVLVARLVLQADVGSAFSTEGYACLQAILLGIQEGFSLVHVEGDSRTIVRKCESSLPDKSEVRGIISNIQDLKNQFHKITFSHIDRSGNGMAHELASYSLQSKTEVHHKGRLSIFTANDWKERRPRELN